MWAYIKSMKGKKFEYDGNKYWFTVEKSPQERALASKVNLGYKLLREKLGEQEEDVEDPDVLDADWNRGSIWVHGHKIAAANESKDGLIILDSTWEVAKVPVDKDTLRELVK